MERISVDPPVPSFARWRKIRERTPGATIMRAMQYEALEGVVFTGRSVVVRVPAMAGIWKGRTRYFRSISMMSFSPPMLYHRAVCCLLTMIILTTWSA